MQEHELGFEEMDQQDFEITEKTHNADDDYFDQVVGALQETVISEEFEQIQSSFIRKHCGVFQQSEENKLQYTPIYKAYQNQIEAYVEKSIQQKVKDCDMVRFNKLLETRNEQIDEQLLDMLLSFDDFDQFKKLMVDYKMSYQQEQKSKQKSQNNTKQTPSTESKSKTEKLNFEPELILSIKPLRKKK